MDKPQAIVVAPYDPAWPACFAQVQNRVWPVLNGVAVRIDHVGSTAVVGLAAEPIIDMDVVVASSDLISVAIERLASINYEWIGDLGVKGREAFRDLSELPLPAHHLYLVVENNRAHLDHWLLRDLLSQDGPARDRYAALKRENAKVAVDDLDVYTARKAALVAELLTKARRERGLAEVEYWVPAPGELEPPTS